MVVMDTRGTDLQMWLSGLRGIPPLTDHVSTSATSSTRNNGIRDSFSLGLSTDTVIGENISGNKSILLGQESLEVAP